jgi:putative SOS response-associated peptidase YedK
MCGRFAFWSDKNNILDHYELEDTSEYYTGYNVTPSYEIAVIRNQDSKELANCHWGLIPHWAKDTKIKPVNTRSDGVATKPFFRDSFKKRRCLIPANGYYEWSVSNGKKQPYFIHLEDSKLFSFAGIWSSWDTPEKTIESCAIITTNSNQYLSKVHDRMPVIISSNEYDTWLDKGGEEMLKPYTGMMQAYPISNRVNSPKSQGPELIQPL